MIMIICMMIAWFAQSARTKNQSKSFFLPFEPAQSVQCNSLHNVFGVRCAIGHPSIERVPTDRRWRRVHVSMPFSTAPTRKLAIPLSNSCKHDLLLLTLFSSSVSIANKSCYKWILQSNFMACAIWNEHYQCRNANVFDGPSRPNRVQLMGAIPSCVYVVDRCDYLFYKELSKFSAFLTFLRYRALRSKGKWEVIWGKKQQRQ